MTNTEIKLIIFLAVKDAEALYSQQSNNNNKRLGADCSLDHQLCIAKFRQIEESRGKHKTIQV